MGRRCMLVAILHFNLEVVRLVGSGYAIPFRLVQQGLAELGLL